MGTCEVSNALKSIDLNSTENIGCVFCQKPNPAKKCSKSHSRCKGKLYCDKNCEMSSHKEEKNKARQLQWLKLKIPQNKMRTKQNSLKKWKRLPRLKKPKRKRPRKKAKKTTMTVNFGGIIAFTPAGSQKIFLEDNSI